MEYILKYVAAALGFDKTRIAFFPQIYTTEE
jgi:hypothetical protein